MKVFNIAGCSQPRSAADLRDSFHRHLSLAVPVSLPHSPPRKTNLSLTHSPRRPGHPRPSARSLLTPRAHRPQRGSTPPPPALPFSPNLTLPTRFRAHPLPGWPSPGVPLLQCILRAELVVAHTPALAHLGRVWTLEDPRHDLSLVAHHLRERVSV